MPELGRRDPRFEVRLDVGLGVFQPEGVCHTLDVSRTGLRLEGAPPLKAGQMVWMHIHLPDRVTIEATGVARAQGDTRRGVGVEFSMFMHGAHGTWEDFLHSLEWSTSGGKTGKERRRWPRDDSLRLSVRSGERQWETVDCSLGGVYIASQQLMARGTELDIELVHPETGLLFPVRAQVVRVESGESGHPEGLGLRYLGIDKDALRALQRFMDWGDSAPRTDPTE